MGLGLRVGPGWARAIVAATVATLLLSGAPAVAQDASSLGDGETASNDIGGHRISGRWPGTWVRHDTEDFGGFELVVGERDGRPSASFLGQEAVSVSISEASISMRLEPASECGGAELRFTFLSGVPIGGSYATYGGCSRTGTYLFGDAATTDAEDRTCPPYASRPGVIVRGCQVVIHTAPGETIELARNELPPWVRDRIVTDGAMAVCIGSPDRVEGSAVDVLIDGRPAVRMGDVTAHGGSVAEGTSRVMINGVPAAFVTAQHVCPMVTGLVPHIGGPIAVVAGRGPIGNAAHAEVSALLREATLAAIRAVDESPLSPTERMRLRREIIEASRGP